MVLGYKKSLLTIIFVASCSAVFGSNMLQNLAKQSPVDPVAAVHSLVPKNMATILTWGSIAAACLPTVTSLYRIYWKRQAEDIVLPVGATLGKDNAGAKRYGVRMGYFGVRADVPVKDGMLAAVLNTKVGADGITPFNVAASLAAAYLFRQATGLK